MLLIHFVPYRLEANMHDSKLAKKNVGQGLGPTQWLLTGF